MEENNKVVVFEKNELILLLLFVIVLVVTSFTIGIRLGKKIAFDESGFKGEDVRAVELKSVDEEDAESTLSDDKKLTDEEKLKKLMEESKERLTEELNKFSSTQPIKDESLESPRPDLVVTDNQSSLSGKFTIQLGSYDNLEEAKLFAEGFVVRGYNPIINKATIENKGTWFRVSLGLFESVEEAKSYIKKENSLFSGQEYVISEMK